MSFTKFWKLQLSLIVISLAGDFKYSQLKTAKKSIVTFESLDIEYKFKRQNLLELNLLLNYSISDQNLMHYPQLSSSSFTVLKQLFLILLNSGPGNSQAGQELALYSPGICLSVCLLVVWRHTL